MIPSYENYRNGVKDLLEASPEELMALFQSLEAPTIEEMNGEYHATMLTQANEKWDLSWRFCVYNPLWPGWWVGKAFRPVDSESGRGYNYFRFRVNKIKQRFPMKTIIAPSRFDGKPAYQLIYRAFHNLCGTMNMVDEVRKLEDGRYLLIGTYGWWKEMRAKPSFFLLEGPVRPYRKDIGRKAKFDLAREVPRLNDPAK